MLLQGRDAVGQSQTGSGKTAAFAIPAIERVDATLRAPQVLIVSSYMRCLTQESLAETRPGGCATNRKLMETLEWTQDRMRELAG